MILPKMTDPYTMKIPIIPSLIALLLLSGIACRKHRMDNNGLPPATQEGKNTLGFLLNGKPWTPKGYNGTSNLNITYDPTYQGGSITIAAYRIMSDNDRQFISFSVDSIQKPINIEKPDHELGFYFAIKNLCEYNSVDSIYWDGKLEITKLDKDQGIISGRFDAILYKPSCDTIRITDGRFDLSLH